MAADFRAARPEKAARELVIVVHLYPVGDAALTSPSRSLASVIGHCIRYCGASGCRLLGEERKWLVRARNDVNGNLKTAKALGLTIPHNLLVLADR